MQFEDLDVLVSVDVGRAERGEEDELILPVRSGVVENHVDGNLV